MIACEQREELEVRLKAAFVSWYELRDLPGKQRDAKSSERKVNNIQRALGDHCAKHGCRKAS